MLKRAWAWIKADWRRWLILPALAVGFVALLRLALGGRPPSSVSPGPVATLTPDQGEEVKARADCNAADAIQSASAQAAADKAAIDAKWGDK